MSGWSSGGARGSRGVSGELSGATRAELQQPSTFSVRKNKTFVPSE